jgi:ribosome-associated protein
MHDRGYSSNRGDPTLIQVDLPITLGQFIKTAGLASTGGDAKRLIVSGLVRVNAGVERRRGHKLASGDVVEVEGVAAQVVPRVVAESPITGPAGSEDSARPGARGD